MKSFSQFLQESYLYEAEVTQGQGGSPTTGQAKVTQSSVTPSGRVRSPKEQQAWMQTNQKDLDAKARKATRNPSGAAADPNFQFKPQGKTTTLPSPARKPGDPWNQDPKKPQRQLGIPQGGPSSQVPGRTLAPAGGTTPKPALPPSGSTAKGAPLAVRTSRNPGIPDAMIRGAQDAANKPAPTQVTPKPQLSAGKPPSGPSPSALRSAANTADKAATVVSNAPKVGKFAKLSKFAGPASIAFDVATSTANEISKRSGLARSLAKGATVAAGGLLGGTAGAIGGGGLLSATTGTAGAMAGGAAAEKAFDVVAGANAAQRRAMATANRQRQVGSSLKGIGGQTTFSQAKPGGPAFMSTGVGPQRKTVQLGKTSVIADPKTGKQNVGYLAFKTGPGGEKHAVYKKAQSPQSLAQTSSNPFERIGRSLLPGAYKASDVAAQQQKLQKAAQSDAARQKALGVKFKPGG